MREFDQETISHETKLVKMHDTWILTSLAWQIVENNGSLISFNYHSAADSLDRFGPMLLNPLSIYRQNHCALKYSEHEIVLVGGQVDDQTYFNNIVAFDYKQKTSNLVVDLTTFGIQLSAATCTLVCQSKVALADLQAQWLYIFDRSTNEVMEISHVPFHIESLASVGHHLVFHGMATELQEGALFASLNVNELQVLAQDGIYEPGLEIFHMNSMHTLFKFVQIVPPRPRGHVFIDQGAGLVKTNWAWLPEEMMTFVSFKAKQHISRIRAVFHNEQDLNATDVEARLDSEHVMFQCKKSGQTIECNLDVENNDDGIADVALNPKPYENMTSFTLYYHSDGKEF